MSDSTQEVRELRWRVKQLNKQVGRQGETIHALRADLAEVRELNSKVDRGALRALERQAVRQAQLINEGRDLINKQQEFVEELLSQRLPAAADTIVS